MDDYKFEMRRKKRGDHCVIAYTDENRVGKSCLCGCGTRIPPHIKHKRRIIKRKLDRDLLSLLARKVMG